MLQTSEKQLLQGKHPICQTSVKTKSAAHMRNQLYHVKHPKNQKMLETSEKQIFQGSTFCFYGCVFIRETKKCCKHAKTSFTRANIRYVKHSKNQKLLQTSKKQLYHGKHPICQTSEKPKDAGNI